MARTVVTISGDEELRRRLNRVVAQVGNLTDPMKDIGKYMTDFFAGEVFASQGRVIGEPWAPLSDSYARWKAKRFPGRPPLIQRGTMQKAFKSRPGRMSVLLYNDDEKFPTHQEGTLRVPARVMMKVDEKRRQRARDILADHIERAITS